MSTDDMLYHEYLTEDMLYHKYVIIGGGVSAGYAAAEFVKQGMEKGDLAIFSKEYLPPYERPVLSKAYLTSENPAEFPDLFTSVGVGGEAQTMEWYEDHGIDLFLCTEVVKVDVSINGFRLDNVKRKRHYAFLIVATGSTFIKLSDLGVPGADASGIFYLREEEDASGLHEAMKKTPRGSAVVLGGGYISLEISAVLIQSKIEVTMVYPEPYCMSQLFTPEIAAFYERYYQAKGVTIIKGTVASSFEAGPDGTVETVMLKDGRELSANIVVVADGARPNIALFKGQLAEYKGGLKVDGSFRTSDSDVYAVGDVATFPLKIYGQDRRVEHADHARRSAQQAVKAIKAAEKRSVVEEYDYLPYLYSSAFSLSWQFYGDNIGDCVLFGEADAAKPNAKFGAYWIHEGRIMGAFLEGGSPEENKAIANVARTQPTVVKKEALATAGLEFAFKI